MKYIDSTVCEYVTSFPIAVLSEKVNTPNNTLERLGNCIWFTYSSEDRRKQAVHRLENILSLTQVFKLKFKEQYPDLIIKHISVCSSYLFKDIPSNDIDLNVIVEGNFFAYKDVLDIEDINLRLHLPVKKISFMVFGERDLLDKSNTVDTIETEDYVHTSLRIREGLVFGIRNILLEGQTFTQRPIDLINLILRIQRQLYHATLMIEGKVDVTKDRNSVLKKAISRIFEAYFYLATNFPNLNLNSCDILEREQQSYANASLQDANNILQEVLYHLSLQNKTL